jgi:predicted nucleic acid-binding protein
VAWPDRPLLRRKRSDGAAMGGRPALTLGMEPRETMQEKVYLDSTIPSYYFDNRESLAAFTAVTRKWWTEMSTSYDLFISDAVLQELYVGDYPRKDEIIEFVSTIPLLPLTEDLEHIVEFYVANCVMPKSLVGDALHLACASYYDMQYLLT